MENTVNSTLKKNIVFKNLNTSSFAPFLYELIITVLLEDKKNKKDTQSI